MDIIQFIADSISAAVRHGFSTTTFILVLVALFRIRAIRNRLLKRLPRRYWHEDRFERMERKLDAIGRKVGVAVEWDARYAQASKSQDVTDGRKNNLKRTWETRVRARFIGGFTSLMGRLYRSKIRRESIQMKKFTSRKFILAVTGAILIVLNDGLDLGIDSDTVIAFAGLLATWIVGESAVDAKRAGGSNKMDEPGDTGPAV